MAAALSVGLALPIVASAGYIPGAVEQPPSAVWALRLLYVGGPTVCYLVALAIGSRYPIDRLTHQRMRREIDQRLLEDPERPEPATDDSNES